MNYDTILARQAMRAALDLRRKAGIGRASPVCVFDLAEGQGIEVRFCPETSLEGMYCRDPGPVILISAHRPPGRQAFTCAHELGHHVFCHGTRVDECVLDTGTEAARPPEEWLADLFASSLLMPIGAVRQAFAARGWKSAMCTEVEVYTIANYLGVGYETLIAHLQWSLRLISRGHAEALSRETPKSIRRRLLGEDTAGQLVVVDRAWSGRAVDIRVGDLVVLPKGIRVEGSSIRADRSIGAGIVCEGVSPGIARAEAADGAWAVFVRVSRKEYIGRSVFRHLEDPDENQ